MLEIEPVTGPLEWTSPEFFIPMENGDVRMVTNLTGSNKHVPCSWTEEHHEMS